MYQPNLGNEEEDAEAFIAEQTLSSISDIVADVGANIVPESKHLNKEQDKLLMPPPRGGAITFASPLPIGLGLKDTIQEYLTAPVADISNSSVSSGIFDGKVERKFDVKNFVRFSETDENEEEGEELDLTGIDDEEIDGYIMSPEG